LVYLKFKIFHLWFFCLVAGVILIDQASKILVTAGGGEFLPNTGILFGFVKLQDRHFFTAAGIIILGFIYWFFRAQFKNLPFVLWLGYGLLVGGCVSNLSDRIIFGYVRDFIDLKIWLIFNLADVALSAGFLMIIFESILTRKH